MTESKGVWKIEQQNKKQKKTCFYTEELPYIPLQHMFDF
jgi:hypothetical protein